jgi:hypothetical protein
MLEDAPFEKAAGQRWCFGGDGWIASAVLLIFNLKKVIEIFHVQLQLAKVVNMREFEVIENLFVSVCQIVVKCIAKVFRHKETCGVRGRDELGSDWLVSLCRNTFAMHFTTI